MGETVKVRCPCCAGAKEPDGQPVDCEGCHEFGWIMETLCDGEAERIAREWVEKRLAAVAVGDWINVEGEPFHVDDLKAILFPKAPGTRGEGRGDG